MRGRLVRVQRSLDVGMIGWTAARPGGLAGRHRPAGEGHRAHPPRRPAAAREPGAPRTPPLDRRRRCTGRSAATRPATPAAPARSRCCCRSRQRAVRPALPRARRGAGGRGAGVRAGPSIRWRSRSHGADRRRDPDAGEVRAGGRPRITPRDAGAPGWTAAERRRQPAAGRQPRAAAPSSSPSGDDELLQLYDGLRPGRSLGGRARGDGDELEARDATRCAALVREARAAYVRRGLVT